MVRTAFAAHPGATHSMGSMCDFIFHLVGFSNLSPGWIQSLVAVAGGFGSSLVRPHVYRSETQLDAGRAWRFRSRWFSINRVRWCCIPVVEHVIARTRSHAALFQSVFTNLSAGNFNECPTLLHIIIRACCSTSFPASLRIREWVSYQFWSESNTNSISSQTVVQMVHTQLLWVNGESARKMRENAHYHGRKCP